MPHRLFDFKMDEGSLVDSGAHPEARVLIFKRDPEAEMQPAPSDLTTDASDTSEKKKPRFDRPKRPKKNRGFVTDKDGDGIVSREETLDADTRGEDEDDMGDKTKVEKSEFEGLDPEVAEYITSLEGYADTLEARVAKAEGGDPDDSGEGGESQVEEVLKSLDPVSRAAVEAAISKADDLEAALQAEVSKRERIEEQRLTEEFTEVAKSYRHIPVGKSVEEFGEVLKQVSKAAPEQYEVLKGVLDAADSALGTNDYIFTEVGKRGTGDNTGDAVEAAAQEMVSKSNGELTIEEARVKVFEERPELYDQTTTTPQG